MRGLAEKIWNVLAPSSMAFFAAFSSAPEVEVWIPIRIMIWPRVYTSVHFQNEWQIQVWGGLLTCGRLAIGLALDHGKSSSVAASPVVTGFLSM